MYQCSAVVGARAVGMGSGMFTRVEEWSLHYWSVMPGSRSFAEYRGFILFVKDRRNELIGVLVRDRQEMRL